jgi:hypothetical protein
MKTEEILKEIEKKMGFDAYKKMLDIYWKQQLKIDDLIKSRENWKKKHQIEVSKQLEGGKS